MKNINVMPANVNVNNNNEMQEPKLVARKRKVNPFSAVIRKANNLFSKQVNKNVAVKKACIMACVMPLYSDLDHFLVEYQYAVMRILDSKRFEKICNEGGLDPRIIAEHLVFEGKAMVEQVLAEGFAPLKGRERLYTEALFQ